MREKSMNKMGVEYLKICFVIIPDIVSFQYFKDLAGQLLFVLPLM